jgi:predicted deacylase
VETNELSFEEYYERFQRIVRKRGGKIRKLANGAQIATFNASRSPRLAIVSGLHGDERAGPLAILRWLESGRSRIRRSLWIVPLVNDLGWNAQKRRWGRKDLNCNFLTGAPKFIIEIMKSLKQYKPDYFIDLHEDESAKLPYLFRHAKDGPETFVAELEKKLHANNDLWSNMSDYFGSIENWVRYIGCAPSTTIETPLVWQLGRRVNYHLRVLQKATQIIYH